MAFGGLRRISALGSFRSLANLPAPIAIDFGVGSLKVLQITGAEQPALAAAAMVETPDDLLNNPAKRLAFQAETLPRLIRSCGFKGKRAVCAIPAGLTYCKHLQLQRADGMSVVDQVRTVISSEIACDPSELVFRHVEVGEFANPSGGSRVEVICMAAARDMVSRLMGAIKASRLEPVGIHGEFAATLRAMASGEGGDGATLYLDLGCGTTKVMVGHGQKLVFAKTIEMGGHHLDKALADQRRCSLAQARTQRLALRPGTPLAGGGAAVATAEPAVAELEEPLEILTDEVWMCLRYYASLFPQRPVERVVFVGGEARQAAVCEQIARRLRLPAHVADPMAAVARTGNEPTTGVAFAGAQPGWTLALGLALSPTDL